MARIEWASLEAVDMDFERNGQFLREVLDKRIVMKSRGWGLILFAYRQRKKLDHEFGEVRFAIEKWVKRKGKWRPYARVRLSFQNMQEVMELGSDWTEDEDGDAAA